MRLFKDSSARVISGKIPFWTKKLVSYRNKQLLTQGSPELPDTLLSYYIYCRELCVFEYVEICAIFQEQTVFHHQDKRMQIFIGI